MKEEQLIEPLSQALETELSGLQIYTTTLRCAFNYDEEVESANGAVRAKNAGADTL